MIISASRRTDIPAFYSEWFINRIRAGYCEVPNPFNRKQVARVSLLPDDVELIVFWTRNPRPLFPHLGELRERGYSFYFQFTLLDYPRILNTKTPSLPSSLDTFRNLANLIGVDKVIWRYDPIVLSSMTGVQFHIRTYQLIAEALRGHTRRSIISLLDTYVKTRRRLEALKERGFEPRDLANGSHCRDLEGLMTSLAHIATQNGLEIASCAEEVDLRPYGIRSGKCVDDETIHKAFGLDVSHKKDPFQRKACGCVSSKDIGVYDTCPFGCQYCYATSSFERAEANHQRHDPNAPALLGFAGMTTAKGNSS